MTVYKYYNTCNIFVTRKKVVPDNKQGRLAVQHLKVESCWYL